MVKVLCHVCGKEVERNWPRKNAICFECKRDNNRWNSTKGKYKNLPYDFHPTKEQRSRIRSLKHFVIRRCQNCKEWFVTEPKKNNMYCSSCILINKSLR